MDSLSLRWMREGYFYVLKLCSLICLKALGSTQNSQSTHSLQCNVSDPRNVLLAWLSQAVSAEGFNCAVCAQQCLHCHQMDIPRASDGGSLLQSRLHLARRRKIYQEPFDTTAGMCLSHFGFPFFMQAGAISVSQLP